MTGEERGAFATYPSLRGAVAFVSGGASGLGAEFVTQLAAQGTRVAFADVQQEPGERLVEAVAAEGWPKPLFHLCDVCDIGALRQAIGRTGDELGPVTVLVNNAANDQRQPVAELTEQEWDAGMAVNVRHHFFAAQAVAPMMRARRWRVDHQPRLDQRPHRSAQPAGVHHRQGRHRRPHPHAGPRTRW